MKTLIETYRKELQGVANFAPDTVKTYISCISKYLDYANEQLKIDPLQTGARDLLQWVMFLKKRGLSHSSLIQHQAALKRFFALLIKLSIFEHNPADALFPIRKKKSDWNQPIEIEAAFRLLRSLGRQTWLDERNFMIISLLWALGLRSNELTSLKVGDFEPEHDPQNKACPEHSRRIGLMRVSGKGNKERALFVVDELYTNLVAYLAHPNSPKEKSEPMFPTQKNKAISTDRVHTILTEAARLAGIAERVTPHVLRHTFATHMYDRKVPVATIETLLGHESTDETSIYIHVSAQHQRKALEYITIEGRNAWQ